MYLNTTSIVNSIGVFLCLKPREIYERVYTNNSNSCNSCYDVLVYKMKRILEKYSISYAAQREILLNIIKESIPYLKENTLQAERLRMYLINAFNTFETVQERLAVLPEWLYVIIQHKLNGLSPKPTELTMQYIQDNQELIQKLKEEYLLQMLR